MSSQWGVCWLLGSLTSSAKLSCFHTERQLLIQWFFEKPSGCECVWLAAYVQLPTCFTWCLCEIAHACVCCVHLCQWDRGQYFYSPQGLSVQGHGKSTLYRHPTLGLQNEIFYVKFCYNKESKVQDYFKRCILWRLYINIHILTIIIWSMKFMFLCPTNLIRKVLTLQILVSKWLLQIQVMTAKSFVPSNLACYPYINIDSVTCVKNKSYGLQRVCKWQEQRQRMNFVTPTCI